MTDPVKLPSAAALLVFPAVVAAAAVPADPVRFSLDQAVRQALAQSPALRLQEAEIDRREGVRDQAAGEFDWITTFAVSRERDRTPAVDALGRESIDAGDTTAYTAGTQRRLRNGVVLGPVADVAVSDRSSPDAPAFGRSRVNFEILVPLLRGLGEESAGANEAAARGEVEVARLLYRHALARQAFGTAQAYWFARAAENALVVRRDDEARARRLHDGIRVLVDSRVFAPSLLLQSEANLRQKSTSTNESELAALEARYALARTMGLPPEGVAAAVAPEQDLPDAAARFPADSEPAVRLRWIGRALDRRADFLAARQSEVPLRVLARQAEIDLKPRVDLSVRAGYAGLNRGTGLLAPLGERATGTNGEIGVALEWPAANTYQRGLLRARRAAQRQAEFSVAQARSDIAAEVCAALAEVRVRADTMANAAATVAIARQAVDQEQLRLKSGETTVLDVINLENLLSSARLAEIDARAGYAVAVARLRFAVGEVFLPDAPDRSFALADLTAPPADEK